ncbi:hypothetical protein GLO73106DRAFT_00041360, partial [Gloeocapsa sp. PCC 73106]
SRMNPCFSLVIARLDGAEKPNFVVWVIDSPLPEGFAHQTTVWSEDLTKAWLAWQEMFSPDQEYFLSGVKKPEINLTNQDLQESKELSYSARLMQHFAVFLWQWLWNGDIRRSFEQNQSFAQGRQSGLRVRLEIRDPDLIPIPWEIMQPTTGKPAISVNPHIIFSRTTTDVALLKISEERPEKLKILLVLGEKQGSCLELEKDAQILKQVFKSASVSTEVDILLQPNTIELIIALDNRDYNIFFYAGHGQKTPDGGLLFLGHGAAINGMELAQVLVRNQVTLAVFNACWSAQPDQQEGIMLERSSLTEVLIHHGVPAVLGMRDSITDPEALTFIEAFSQGIASGMSIDEAVKIARQQLLIIYKYNQPAWTLPVLYMHPSFDGTLLNTAPESTTILPSSVPLAYLRNADHQQVWEIQGVIRIGRHPIGKSGQINQVVITEAWVSSEHAMIFYRDIDDDYGYFLKDVSRFGT